MCVCVCVCGGFRAVELEEAAHLRRRESSPGRRRVHRWGAGAAQQDPPPWHGSSAEQTNK